MVEFAKLGRRIEPAESRALPNSAKAIPTPELVVMDGKTERAELFLAHLGADPRGDADAARHPARAGQSADGALVQPRRRGLPLHALPNCLNIVQSMIAQGKLDFWLGLALPHTSPRWSAVLFAHQLSLLGRLRSARGPAPVQP